jgi:SAM-dependent methyltransferase
MPRRGRFIASRSPRRGCDFRSIVGSRCFFRHAKNATSAPVSTPTSESKHFTALSENLDAGLTLLEEHQRLHDGRPLGDVLVVGCGPGREAFALAGHGGRVTGIDSEPAMLARARDEARRRGVGVDFRVVGRRVVRSQVRHASTRS